MIFQKKRSSVNSYIITAALGVTAGAIVGMLFAPKKGRKMRRLVANNIKAIPSKLPFRGSTNAEVSEFLVN